MWAHLGGRVYARPPSSTLAPNEIGSRADSMLRKVGSEYKLLTRDDDRQSIQPSTCLRRLTDPSGCRGQEI